MRNFAVIVAFSVCFVSGLVADAFASSPEQLPEIYQETYSRYRLRQTSMNAAFAALQTESGSIIQENNAGDGLARKSKGRAFLQSLLLPGWGQHYAESKTMMKVFIVSEVTLWATYLGFRLTSDWKRGDYRSLAATNAGVNLAGKPDSYFFDIGIYDSILEYNQARLRDRDTRSLYPETEEYAWDWDNTANRIRFDGLRIESDEAQNSANLVLGLIFVNHLVSALQSTLAVHNFNEKLEQANIGINLDVDSFGFNKQLKLRISKAF